MCKPGSGRPSNGHRLDQPAPAVDVLHRRLRDAGGGGEGAHPTHPGGPLLQDAQLSRGGLPVTIGATHLSSAGTAPAAILVSLTAALDRPTALGAGATPAAHLLIVIVPTGQRAEARGLRLGHADPRAEALLAMFTRALLVRRLGLPARGARPDRGTAGDGAREMRRREALDGPTRLAGQVLRLTAFPSPPSTPTFGAATPRLVGLDLPLRQIDQRAADRARALLPTFDAGVNSPPAATMALRTELLPKPRWGPVAYLTPALLAPQDLTVAGTGAAPRMVAPCFPTLWMMLVLVRLRFRDRDRHPRKEALVSPSTGGQGAPLSLPHGHSGGHHRRQVGGEMTLPLAVFLIVLQVLQLKGLTTVLARPCMGHLPARGATEHELAPCPRELRVALRATYLHSTPPGCTGITSYSRRSIAGLVW